MSAEQPASFNHRLRVRYGECDPQGIVFNANYMLYVDVAFTELWREAVGPWQDMVGRGLDVVVAEANLRFLAPARFDDELDLRARIARLGHTSIATQIDMLRAEEPLVSVRVRHVCVSTGTGAVGIGGLPESVAKTELPDWIRDGLARFVAPDP